MRGEEIHSRDTRYHHISVKDVGMLRFLQFERNRQSSMFLDAPFDTDFEYPAYFHLALAIDRDARRALVIGLGGGSVVKRMWRDYPEMTIDVVELDPEVVEVAREYFALPDDARIRIHVGDGRRFLEECAGVCWDIVMVDAFDDDVVPRPLTTEEFLGHARSHMAEGGVFALNMIGFAEGDKSKPFRSLYRTMRNVWRHVWVFVVNDAVDSYQGKNLLLFASDAPLERPELLRRIVTRVDGRVTVPAFDCFDEDLYTAPVRTGDVPLIVDPPSAKRRG
jgi:spermidine synthase